MSADFAERIVAFLAMHHAMSRASHGREGLHPANLLYAYGGLALFWVSDPNTQHSREIEAEPRVAVTIAADNSDFSVIRSLQLAGTTACIVTEDRRAGVLSGGAAAGAQAARD